MTRLRTLVLAALLPITAPAAAQTSPEHEHEQRVDFPVRPVPFGPGERMRYKVSYGIAGEVGESSLEVMGIDTIRNSPSYHLDLKLKGGILFAKVNDHMQSWLDVEHLQSHRFDQNVHEVNYDRHRILDFYPDSGIWRRQENNESGPLATKRPLDDLSFLYFVRTLPLEVGVEYELDRYFKDEGNPVKVRVLRRETVEVPAGEFETIVVQPLIKTDGLFSEDGRAEVYFSDDEHRVLVQLKTKLSIGTLNLELASWTPGTRLLTTGGEPSAGSP